MSAMDSKEAVLKVWPYAFSRQACVGSAWIQIATQEMGTLGAGICESEAWDDAASRLSAPIPDEGAVPEPTFVWIDPRTKEPCKRCNGTGTMPPWPGSKGLVSCGICRATEAPPSPSPSVESQPEPPFGMCDHSVHKWPHLQAPNCINFSLIPPTESAPTCICCGKPIVNGEDGWMHVLVADHKRCSGDCRPEVPTESAQAGGESEPRDTHGLIVRWSDDDKLFIARILEADWCSGHGSTRRAAIEMAEDNYQEFGALHPVEAPTTQTAALEVRLPKLDVTEADKLNAKLLCGDPFTLEDNLPKQEQMARFFLCRERQLFVSLGERDAALQSIAALEGRVKRSQEEMMSGYEWSTVANWRTQQVESAKAAGLEFTDPGVTCRNVRAETAESSLAAKDSELARLREQIVKAVAVLNVPNHQTEVNFKIKKAISILAPQEGPK